MRRLPRVSSIDSSWSRDAAAGHPPVAAADEADPHALARAARRGGRVQDALVEAHEVADLVDGAAPVLGREGVDGQPRDARARARRRRRRTAPPRRRRGPSVRFRPRFCAQRPLPSMTQATWVGMRWRSSPRDRLTSAKLPPAPDALPPLLPASRADRRHPSSMEPREIGGPLPSPTMVDVGDSVGPGRGPAPRGR